MIKYIDVEYEKMEQIARGKRLKEIRENDLKMYKTELARHIGVSSQFLGMIEAGKGNLTYRSLKELCNLSGHTADYILFGLDDNCLKETRRYLEYFDEKDIINSLNIIRDLAILFKKNQ